MRIAAQLWESAIEPQLRDASGRVAADHGRRDLGHDGLGRRGDSAGGKAAEVVRQMAETEFVLAMGLG
ncbi:hypothetical protein D3C79_935570 [compost metagenome]